MKKGDIVMHKANFELYVVKRLIDEWVEVDSMYDGDKTHFFRVAQIESLDNTPPVETKTKFADPTKPIAVREDKETVCKLVR